MKQNSIWIKIKYFGFLICISFIIYIGYVSIESTQNNSLNANSNIETHFSYLEDPEGKLTIEDILKDKGSNFSKLPKNDIEFGYSKSTFWLRIFSKQLLKDSGNWVLSFNNSRLVDVQFFELDENNIYKQTYSGVIQPFKDRYNNSLRAALPFKFNTNKEKEIFVRINSSTSLNTKLEIDENSDWIKMQNADIAFLGFFYGVALALFIYNFMLHFSIKDKNFKYYLFFIASMIIFLMIMDGIADMLFPLLSGTWMRWNRSFGLVAVIFALEFCDKFLDIKSNYPKIYKYKLFVNVVIFTSFVLTLRNDHQIAAKMTDFCLFLGFTFCILSGIISSMQGYRPARYYLASWGALFILVLFWLASMYNILPINWFTSHSITIGVTLMLIIISLAVSDQINMVREQLLNALEQNNNDLEKTVEQRTAEINQVVIELRREMELREQNERKIEQQRVNLINSARMASLGEMAAGIAHEINNPLTIINANATNIASLLEETVTPLNEKILKKTHKINETVTRITKIVNSMRALSRHGNVSQLLIVSLKNILNEVLELTSARFRNNGINFTNVIENENVAIECCAVQISQIFINLLNNAFDAIEYLEEKWISLVIKENGDFVEIRITNSGPVISPEVKQKLFQPFFTTKEVGKGTGLGLSITRGIVLEHKGEIYLDEREPHTCFVIKLPKQQNRGRLKIDSSTSVKE